jgi:23S rRNA (uracil1939-C5)-methyltransferase
MPKNFPILTLNIADLDERGYGIAQHGNKIVQVLNALPGETVEAQIFRKKKGGLQGVAKSVLQASNLRVSPREDHFLCCSPWQILDFEAENQIKASSIKKFYQEVKIDLSDFDIISLPNQTWNYRNKAEFSFYSDETEQLNLAFFGRDSRSKYPHTGCVLMAEGINIVGRKFLDFLNARKIQARQLKSIILRYCYAQNKVVACLFFKDENLQFEREELLSLVDDVLQGVSVIYSTHKSPSSCD